MSIDLDFDSEVKLYSGFSGYSREIATPISFASSIYSADGSGSPSLSARVSVGDRDEGVRSATREALAGALKPVKGAGLDDGQIEEIIEKTETALTTGKLKEIAAFIEQNRSEYAGQSVCLSARETGLSRPVDFFADGTVYIHFDKIDEGDRLVGKGTAKMATLSVNYDTSETCVRTVETGASSKEIEFFTQVKEIPGAAKLYHSRIFASEEGMKTAMMMPFYSNGALSDVLDGDGIDLEVGVRLAESILETAAQFHSLGFAHGDLQDGNIFLDEIGQPYLADFGHSKVKATDKDRLDDMVSLRRFFSVLLGDTHFLTKIVKNSENAMVALQKHQADQNNF